jgi:signal transduction histidine kinase/ligand-binding sensor domain-containing protein/DNA-binding response OmpR family regulator
MAQLGILNNSLAQHKWENLRWRYLTVEDGLLSYRLSDICQDKQGFIWLSSWNGLNRFDGYQFDSFTHQPSDTTSLSNNSISDILEDSYGVFWVGTSGGGINILKENRQSFRHLRHQEGVATSLASDLIQCIYEDSDSTIWVGTRDGTLHLYDRETDSFTRFKLPGFEYPRKIAEDQNGKLIIAFEEDGAVYFDKKTKRFQPDELTALSSNKSLVTVFVDSDGDVWLGGDLYGVFKYTPTNKQLKVYPVEPEKDGSLNHKVIFGIYEKEKGSIWVATDGGGINILDKATDRFSYISTADGGRGFNSKAITVFFEDRDGGLWAGTVNGGVNYSSKYYNSIDHYTYENGNTNGLSGKSVLSLCESHDGNVWVGLDQGGVNYFDRQTEQFTHYMNDPKNKNSLVENVITKVYEDSNQDLYIGTYLSGFDIFNKERNEFRHLWGNNDNDPHTPIYIKTFFEDSYGDFWIGTVEKGLAHYDRETGAYTFYTENVNDPYAISDQHALYIYEDQAKNLWIGTADGLNLFDRATKRFKSWGNINKEPNSLLGNQISCIYEDEDGYIWLATDKALNRFDPKTESFKRYMIGQYTRSILPHQEDLWVSTDEGIFRFSKEKETAELLNLGQDIIRQQFEFSGIKTKDGKLWFGSLNGIYSFFPEQIIKNPIAPPIIIDKLLINNKEVHPNVENSPLQKHISQTKELTLTHSQSSVFTFEFFALNYTMTQHNQYAYILKGFEQDWNRVGTQRKATYTNIDPGTYTFSVKGSNNDGVWNEAGSSIKITILPPWWKSWWAYTLYILTALTMIFMIWKTVQYRIKLLHELRMAQLEKDKAEEIVRMKSQFFTNISHEFKTPLTLILGPLNKLIASGNGNANIKKNFLLMRENANRLLTLIDQLMDFRKAEIGQLKIKAIETNLIPYVKTIVNSFEERAKAKQINLEFVAELNELMLWFDSEKLDKVLFNLLSNAFKHTPKGGSIKVMIKKEAHFAQILVEDTGCGIEEKEQEKIFTRFYQVSPKNLGSGIGLSFSKILVELHKGSISLNSEFGKGSQFTVKLRLGNAHFSDQELVEKATEKAKRLAPKVLDAQNYWQNQSAGNVKSARVLIVEDEQEIRTFLRDVLEPLYEILEAENGMDGLEKAKSGNPDLIISDIMMPEMNGFAFCKQIKTNLNTSHIPVILLTARSGEESLMEGLNIGADDYLTKPFNPQLLIARIKNLIQSRQKLKDRFMSEFTMSAKEVTITSLDEQFMIDAVDVVERFIDNQEFTVDTLVREMGMSRSVFSKKIKALSGQSPSEFIRTIKLKKATKLLLYSGKSISEVAYDLGFITPKTFRTNFKKQFGQTPSEFIIANKRSVDEKTNT